MNCILSNYTTYLLPTQPARRKTQPQILWLTLSCLIWQSLFKPLRIIGILFLHVKLCNRSLIIILWAPYPQFWFLNIEFVSSILRYLKVYLILVAAGKLILVNISLRDGIYLGGLSRVIRKSHQVLRRKRHLWAAHDRLATHQLRLLLCPRWRLKMPTK